MVAKVEDDDFLWGEMRTMRDIFNNEKQTNSCYVLVSDELIKEHFQNLSQILSIDDIDNKAKSLSENVIKKGVDMFLYLNSCINQEVKEYWRNLYGTIMQAPCCFGFGYEFRSVKEILLPISKALKSTKTKDGQKIAQKIINKLSSDFKFQYLQPNPDESNIEWARNVQKVKG